jgi:hypothetical protein
MANKIDKKDAWFAERFGKFTASEIWKLWGLNKEGKFMTTGLTYIETKAVESLTEMHDRPELEFVEPILHGKAHEALAFYRYQDITRNNSMRYFGSEEPIYLSFNKYSGGSPDGLMGEMDYIKWGLELKCPFNSGNHYKYLKFKDQWDLKEKKFEYYCQVQFLLMITKAEGWHWASYDDRFKDNRLKMKIIEVMPDLNFQNALELRIDLAEVQKKKFIKEILELNKI